MTATLPSTQLRPAARDRGKTVFEQSDLPGFTRWMVEQIEQRKPDYLVPAETKGARLLEAVASHARELGAPISVPILYGPALAYIEPSVLSDKRVIIVDDAVRTGTNLERHWHRVTKYGARDVQALVCIGDADDKGHRRADCYRLVSADRYRTYAWQLTELVAARGLPPEVDHQVFELRLPARSPEAWERLEAMLGRYGTVSIDRPGPHTGIPASMTLHFPKLPGTVTHPTEGEVRNEGVTKLRFFPDRWSDRIHVVPVSFPTLDLPPEASESVAVERAEALAHDWMDGDDDLAAALIAEARTRDPETVFRMLSACAEADLVRGLARALAGEPAIDELTLAADRDLFHKLYGHEAGERIADRVDLGVAAALRQPSSEPRPGDEHDPTPPLRLDSEVVETTRQIAKGLKSLYDDRAEKQGFDPNVRVGRSLQEMTDELEDGDRLFVSRCMDFGLSMTTLVPYVQEEPRPGGGLRLRREYRVSEATRGDAQPYTDIDAIHRELSNEAVALIASYVSTHSRGRYRGRSVPEHVVAGLVAILRPLELAHHSEIELHAVPSEEEGVAMTPLFGVDPIARGSTSSDLFAFDAEGLRPTAYFRDLSKDRGLQLDATRIAHGIEAWLDLIMPLIDDQPDDQVEPLLTAWAMTTDGRLGLSHVLHTLDSALRHLERPLRRVRSGDPHGWEPDDCVKARDLASTAVAKLALLGADWTAAPRAYWQDPSRRIDELLGTLAAPTEGAPYEYPAALAELVSAVSVLVERLYETSARAWEDRGDRGELPRLVVASCAEVERTLTSLSDVDTVSTAPSGRAGIDAAVDALLRLRFLIGAFAAASAGVYRGPQGVRVTPSDDERATTVLFADLEKSLDHALVNPLTVTHGWKEAGLNLLAQWARALSGWEGRDRDGDAMWLEFADPGDPALICSAATRELARALASIGTTAEVWAFHSAVDAGPIRDGNSGNATAQGLNRASRVAKARKEELPRPAFVTQEAVAQCSPALRDGDFTASFGEQVSLTDSDVEGARVVPLTIHSEAVMRRMAQRIRAVAERIEAEAPPVAQEQSEVEVGALDRGDGDESVGSSDVAAG